LFENCRGNDKEAEILLASGIAKLKAMKIKISENFEGFRKEIDKKEKEMVKIVDDALNEKINIKSDAESMETKIKTTLANYKGLIEKGGDANCMDFEMILTRVTELKSLEKSNEVIRNLKEYEIGKYEPPSIDQALKSLKELTISKEMISDKPKTLFDTTIIKEKEQQQMLIDWVKEAYPKDGAKLELKLLYRGTRDGINPTIFHSKCNNKGATLTVISNTAGYVLGGFIKISWRSKEGYSYDSDAFIFSINHKTKHAKQKNAAYSIYDSQSYLPIFGDGHDIYTGTPTTLTSNGNHTYELPPETNGNTYLAGSENSTLADIEVFSVIPLK